MTDGAPAESTYNSVRGFEWDRGGPRLPGRDYRPCGSYGCCLRDDAADFVVDRLDDVVSRGEYSGRRCDSRVKCSALLSFREAN